MIFIFLIYIFLPISLSEKNIRTLNLYNEITIRIKGTGPQTLFVGTTERIIEAPSKIIINNVQQNNIQNIYNLTEKENVITMEWNIPLPHSEYMFYNLENISYIDLSKFDGSGLNSMRAMFNGCTNLKSINLDISDTSIVKNMEELFSNCISLTSVDISKLNTHSVRTMVRMFYNCILLKTLDFSNFDTRAVESMLEMFSGAESLIYLDLSKFSLASCTVLEKMFYGCKSLIYVNLISFSDYEGKINSKDMFSQELNNLLYCIDTSQSSRIFGDIKNISQNNDCENICFKESRKIIFEEKKCSDKCDDINKYEYNTICYNSEQKVIDTQITEFETHKFYFSEEYDEKSDKYEKYEKFFENTEEFEKYEKISSEDLFKGSIKINSENISNKDNIIKNIKNDLINGNLDSLLQNVINGKKEDLIATDKDTIYQITTTENQKNKNYDNISSINFGECEKKLKEEYKLNQNLSLIVLKIDYYMPGLLIPIIGYEIYEPINKTQLNLSYCKDKLIKLNIPVSIDEQKVFKHNPNSEYYTDECFSYTTDNGTDIILNDRHNEFDDFNLSLCENNCTFNGYSSDVKKVKCECETKPKLDLISTIIQEENLLSSNFIKDNTTSNLVTMKCVNTLFCKDGLLKNAGSYILLFSIIFFTISTIIFYKCGYKIIEENINDLKLIRKKSSKKLTLNQKVKKIKRKKRKNKSLPGNLSNPIRKNKKKFSNISKNSKRESNNIILSSKSFSKNSNILLDSGNKDKDIKIHVKIKEKDIKAEKFKDSELFYFSYKCIII